ncbi:GbsR/MarR family transcriptional regulator [Aquibacillus halophilus]|uniref:HTH-type transcriptional regulator n=1 Tax=Aquibacillus halophilus TaxID=930132 RepID=A0A6A8D6Y1_9BACI|nr:GbsR/MarR family transcriptional regulator [Aquibacillus halophilus]MRH41503.1 GbsR/MarR family transcriptional regulator [Aquibacillus halophilus]
MNSENKLEQVNNRIIEQIAENMKSYGFPGTIGRVYAIIYFEGKPLDLDTLSEKTGMSKTRMSQVLREMAQINLAEKVFVKGSRKDFYHIDRDYYQNFISLFTSNWKNVVERNKKIEKKNVAELTSILEDNNSSDEEKEKAAIFMKQSDKSLEYFDWIDRLVEFFESNEIFNHVPKRVEK